MAGHSHPDIERCRQFQCSSRTVVGYLLRHGETETGTRILAVTRGLKLLSPLRGAPIRVRRLKSTTEIRLIQFVCASLGSPWLGTYGVLLLHLVAAYPGRALSPWSGSHRALGTHVLFLPIVDKLSHSTCGDPPVAYSPFVVVLFGHDLLFLNVSPLPSLCQQGPPMARGSDIGSLTH